MKKITLILASVVLALSAATALAMGGHADRFNEAKSPGQTTATGIVSEVAVRS